MEKCSLVATKKRSASPTQLLSLPYELLCEIMTFTMASETLVYFWPFLDIARYLNLCGMGQERGYATPSEIKSPYLPNSRCPESQREHHLDWLMATGTCHRLRECGRPAFFRDKVFIIPPITLRVLLDGKARSSNFDMAMHWIHEIVVPASKFLSGTDFMILPKYHRFTRLRTLTIWAPASADSILEAHERDRPWPQVPPKELLILLGQLGLRVNDIKVKLIIIAKGKSEVPSIIDNMEESVYPQLQTLIRRRMRSGDPPH